MKDSTLQIKDSIRRLYDAKKDKDAFDEHYNQVKKKEQLAISNYMFTNLEKGEKSFTVTLDEGERYYSNHVKLNVTRVRKKRITWMIDKLKKKLPKDIYKSAITKQYTVTDMDGLIKYLKTCNVDPKKFKKFIGVTESVNQTMLDNLYETGCLKAKDIEGCYEVKMGEPYIRLTEIKE